MKTAWYNEDRVRQQGSVLLSRALPALRAENERRRSRLLQASVTSGSMSMQDFSEWVIGGRADESMSERGAMSVGAVYACVNLIAGAIASMPLDFYRADPSGDRIRYKPDLWWLFNEQTAPAWNAAVFWEYVVTSLLLRGDAFVEIVRPSPLAATIDRFEPLHPGCVEVSRLDDHLVYTVGAQPWERSRPPRVLHQDDVLHIPGPGFDGLRGMSQIQYTLRAPAATARATEEFNAAFFRNGARPDYALQTDGAMSQEQVDQLRAQVAEKHGGAARAFTPMVLSGGLKVQPLTMLAKDAQLVEQRGANVEDIARVFGVPPFMIGHNEKTTSWGSGVAEMGIGFAKYTLQRHLVKIEQEINRKVFRTARNFCEFNAAGLERGDIKTRYEAYRVALGRAGEAAWIDIDEIRRFENLPPREVQQRGIDDAQETA